MRPICEIFIIFLWDPAVRPTALSFNDFSHSWWKNKIIYDLVFDLVMFAHTIRGKAITEKDKWMKLLLQNIKISALPLIIEACP